jgi:tetratricopeptide (TPR) repeat protein
MHSIYELESRWFKYKIKSYLPYIIIIVFGIILTISLIFIFDSKKDSNLEKVKKTHGFAEKNHVEDKTTSKEIIKENIPTTPAVLDKAIKKDEKIILKPSFDFMKKLGTDSLNSYASKENRNDTSNESVQSDTQTKNIKKIVEDEQHVQKTKINISIKEAKDDINDVIKRFKKNNNPALSLFIAKKYYQLRNYQQAYNYALITNEINNDIEQSWIVFAKSLVKLNKKNKAIKTLTKYVKHSSSGNAKVLLDDIKSGKFK